MKTKFTNELIDRIIELAEIEGYITIICSELNISISSFYYQLNSNPSFRNRFLIARGKLAKHYKEKMIDASEDKRNKDWRVYKYLLSILNDEFKEYKQSSNLIPQDVKQINFIISNLEEGLSKARSILKHTIPSKYVQDNKVKLIESNEQNKKNEGGRGSVPYPDTGEAESYRDASTHSRSSQTGEEGEEE